MRVEAAVLHDGFEKHTFYITGTSLGANVHDEFISQGHNEVKYSRNPL